MTPQAPGDARPLAVVVLAAGQGTRMKSATPKVLHTISGRTLLGHVLAAARELRPAHTVVVVRHERDRVVASLDEAMPGLLVVDQDEVPGTGRAVELAVGALPAAFDGDVVVLSGDVPLIAADAVRELLRAHAEADAAATVLTAALEDPSGYGRIVRGADGLVDRIVEHRDADAAVLAIAEINTGTYVFRHAALRRALPEVGVANDQGEKYLTDVVALLRGAGEVVAARAAEDAVAVMGVNDRAQLAEAERRMNERIVRGHQLAGVTIRDPRTTWIDVEVAIGADTEILPGTQLRGATTIGEGAVVGPDTTLTDTEVDDFATVERAVANLAVIGAGASVGPFAYLRPGTVLGPAGKIGTYVETKNARIGRGSKVPHLSYIGDAEIGEDTNLGASTITANYDGRDKHRTRIGSHVHTAVHTTIVAPVEIGDGATIAGGSRIWKDVPPDSLAMNPTQQRHVEGWVPPYRRGADAAGAAESDRGASADQ